MIIRNRHFLILDIIFLSLTPLLALVLRQDITAWQAGYPMALLQFTVLALAVKLLIFYLFGIYRRYWRYASIGEMIAIGSAVLTATIAIAGIFFGIRVLGFGAGQGLPRSVPFIDGLLTFVVVGGTRFSVRVMGHQRVLSDRQADLKPVLIAGAGDAGAFNRDPADRIIVATARFLDCPVITIDQKILAYPHVKHIIENK